MTSTERPAPLFGVSARPAARTAAAAIKLAQVADETGLDLYAVQDHPYNPGFLETWTLLSVIGGMTQRVRLLPDVANLPLRPPAMLAKAAATLDLLTGGRVELGLGAGAAWDAIESYGGPRRTPGEAVAALEEAMRIIRAIWTRPGEPINFAGQHYSLAGAHPGPAPAHPIGIWLGALGPRMLELTGRLADGWIVSASYIPPETLPAYHEAIDRAAESAGRPPSAIRRAYNVAGVVQRPGGMAMTARVEGVTIGTPDRWVDELARYYAELRMDTFIFWPVGGDEEGQTRLFAEEVVPMVHERLQR